MNSPRVAGLMTALVVAFALVGCDRDESVRAYQAPKDTAPPALAMASPDVAAGSSTNTPSGGSAQQTGEPITWDVPAGWKQLPGTQMRYASFQVLPDDPQLQLTVIPLGGENTLLPNVVRWQGQLGLPASTEADLPNVVKTVKTAGGADANIVDLIGPQEKGAQRILAALVPHDDRVWFFKLQGASDKIESQKQNFDALVRSIRFTSAPDLNATRNAVAPAPAPAPASAGQPASAGATNGASGQPTSSAQGAAWTLPAGWTAQPDRPMRVATFTAGAPGDAEVIVSRFPVNSGSLLDNINRWRTQAGVEPITDAASQQKEPITVDGREGAVYDFASAQKRIRVAMITDGAQAWFVKLQGTADGVAKQKAAFDQFVASMKFQGQ